MNAAAPAETLEFSPLRAERSGSAERPAVHTSLGAGLRCAILTVFWTYVALSNLLYASSMSSSLDPVGSQHYFANWKARVLQHLVLYPILLGCVSLSLRVGWRPLRRAVPIQVAVGLVFATLASPVLAGCEWLVGEGKLHHAPWSLASFIASLPNPSFKAHGDLWMWIASITSFLLTYGFALALVTGFALYRRFKESELRRAALERAWSGARLAALRMQLSPHTLFNLLHTIRGQIAWDPDAARQMVVQLGDLLRRLLAAGERDLSPLTEEIAFARLYLELQQQRFADRLSLELPEPGSLPNTWVPSLILQPLIENAVVHGLADHSGPVCIRVESAAAHGMLRLNVTNTMSARRAQTHRAAREFGEDRIGLRNVRERIAVHFGERAVLEAGPAPERDGECARWAAEIRMPLIAGSR